LPGLTAMRNLVCGGGSILCHANNFCTEK